MQEKSVLASILFKMQESSKTSCRDWNRKQKNENFFIRTKYDLAFLYSISLQQISISQQRNCFDIFNRL